MYRRFLAIVADLRPRHYPDGSTRRHGRLALRQLARRLDGVPVLLGHGGPGCGRAIEAHIIDRGTELEAVEATLELEDVGAALAHERGTTALSLDYQSEVHEDADGATVNRNILPGHVALVYAGRCERARITRELPPLAHRDEHLVHERDAAPRTDTASPSALRPACKLAAGEDSRSCPIGSAGENLDGKPTLGDLVATPEGREIYGRALGARYDLEARTGKVGSPEALAAFHAVIDPALRDLGRKWANESKNDRADGAKEMNMTCKCDTTDTAKLRELVRRIDGDDVLAAADKKGQYGEVYIRSYVRAAVTMDSARGRAYRDALGAVQGDPDPDDTAHRAARGANSAVRDPGKMPDVANMTLQQCKAAALSVGAYASSIRPQLATALLDRLRELGADQVADQFERAFAYGDLSAPSDDELEKSGAAHGDSSDTDERVAAARLAAAGRAMHADDRHAERHPDTGQFVPARKRGRTRDDVLGARARAARSK